MSDNNKNYEIEIETVTDNLKKYLKEKNRRYGNSALDPIDIFSSHIRGEDQALDNILVRLDDKLNRVKNSNELRKNDVIDIAGYLILLCINRGWNNFNDQID